MKKWLFPFAFVATLAGCSVSNESKQQANDTYQKSDAALPLFAPLNTAGVSLPKQDTTYQLPQVKVKKRIRWIFAPRNAFSDYSKFYCTV